MLSAIKINEKFFSYSMVGAILLALSLFSVPISSSAKSIFVSITISYITLMPAYRKDLLSILNQRWCQASILLFFLAVIACLWSPATTHDKMFVIEKYSKLLYLPILAVGFRDPYARSLGLKAILLAMFVTVLVSFMQKFGLIAYVRDWERGFVFRNHIMTSNMMSFAAYLSGFLFVRETGLKRIGYGLLCLLFSYHVLFMNTGRTGYVMYLLMMVALMIQVFSWKQALVAVSMVCVLFVGSYYQSSVMQNGTQRMVADWKMYHSNEKNTSLGYRLQFYQYAESLFKKHPLIGNGTGSFTWSYRMDSPIPGRDNQLNEPHNQYWLVADEFGLIGLSILLFLFGSLLVRSYQLNYLRPVALVILITFLLGNLSDSLLFYSGSGYFFIFIMALCLGEQVKPVK